MVAPERPAVDKLLAKKVLVSNIVTPIELIVFPVGNRKTQATKPVAAIVMQITG